MLKFKIIRDNLINAFFPNFQTANEIRETCTGANSIPVVAVGVTNAVSDVTLVQLGCETLSRELDAILQREDPENIGKTNTEHVLRVRLKEHNF